MAYGFCATITHGKSVFSLANSSIYVQNLIQFDKSCHAHHFVKTTFGGDFSHVAENATLNGHNMKKFSTAIAFLALASVFSPTICHAAGATAEDRVDPASVHCTFRADAPDQHLVVAGDTLWSISGHFLEHSWCWPQVWGLNRDQIQHPHWIYPGQIVYFDRATGRLRLGTPIGGTQPGSSDNSMQRQIRTNSLGEKAISSIPASIIEPFLSKPLVITEDELKKNARIMAIQEGHVMVGKGDRAYVRGDLQGETNFQVYRPGKPLIDPDTKKAIGYEAIYLGTVKLTHTAKTADEASTIEVVTMKEEMGIGDRLRPAEPAPFINYVPHQPEQPVSGRLMSIYEGVNNAGQNQIVSINRGKNNGIDVGTVLEMQRYGAYVADPTDGKKMVKLPDEEYGSMFIFRVFDNISYGLIMEVTQPAEVGDVVKSPE
jgi:nucleoid-associated protein YgaU